MPEYTGVMTEVQTGSNFTKFKVGSKSVKAWHEGDNTCQQSQDEIKVMAEKNVTADCKDVPGNYQGKTFTYHNAVSIKVLGSPPSYETDRTVERTAVDWELKDRRIHRSAITKSFILMGYFKTPEEAFAWVYEEMVHGGKKPAEITPEDLPFDAEGSRPSSRMQLMKHIGEEIKALNWTPQDGRDCLLAFAENNHWGNLVKIKDDGLKCLSDEQLTLFAKHLPPEPQKEG